jgi:hypothetical protein
MQAYSDPKRENEPYALPDIEVFELTAHEAAEQDEDLIWEYLERFPLANMNSRDRDAMFDAMIEEQGITGGWFWWSCFPGCLPDGPAIGPFESRAEALKDAQDSND